MSASWVFFYPFSLMCRVMYCTLLTLNFFFVKGDYPG